MKPKGKQPSKKEKNKRLFLLVTTVGVIVLLIVFVFGIFIGLNNKDITPLAAIWFSILGFLFLSCFIAAVISGMHEVREYTPLRLNYDSFQAVENVKSEPQFLEAISKRFNNDLRHGALVTFSIYKIKKDAINQLGYQSGAKITEMAFAAIDETFTNIPDVIYGYDYNENFLLYMKYSHESDMNATLATLKENIGKKFEKTDVQIGRDFVFGVYFHNDAAIEPSEMLRRSLMACDFGNFNNQGGIFVYEESMFVNGTANNLQFYEEIVQGLARHEFIVYYQPKFDLKLNRFTGAEALVRWNHPKRGFLSPAAFIPFAEKSDLITQIDHYVFAMVCQDVAAWKIKGERLLEISVNLSQRTLYQNDLVVFLSDTMKNFKMNPLLLEMEITESATSKDTLFVLSIIKQIQALNVKVSIDDFGTGYSSLSSLKRLPFNVVKMDRSFLGDIEVDQKAREVVQSVVKLVHALDMTLVAEGIQTLKQVQLLKEMGCDKIQGFYYSRPLIPDEYLSFIRKNRFEKKGK